MSEELKACPFCGGEAVFNPRDRFHAVSCQDVLCQGLQTVSAHATKAQAVAAWNKRAPVSEFAVLAITTAYEQGVGKGRDHFYTKRAVGNPYAKDDTLRTHDAWRLGFAEGTLQAERANSPDRDCPSQVNTGSHAWKLRRALQRAHDWMDSQANASMYKVSFSELASERDAIAEVLNCST